MFYRKGYIMKNLTNKVTDYMDNMSLIVAHKQILIKIIEDMIIANSIKTDQVKEEILNTLKTKMHKKLISIDSLELKAIEEEKELRQYSSLTDIESEVELITDAIDIMKDGMDTINIIIQFKEDELKISRMKNINPADAIEKLENGIVVSVVTIDSENAVKATGRPKGRYVTIEAGQINEEDEECLARAAKELSRVLREFVKSVCDKKIYHAIVVGLGNRNVTPDALGPRTVDNLFITRHIVKEYGRYAFGNENVNSVCGLVPGVMAQTGMECLEIIKGVVKETKPDFVVTIDALAARSTNC